MAEPFTRLALFARNDDTRRGFRRVAERAGLTVVELTADPSSVGAAATEPGTAFRAPGGLLAAAIAAGTHVGLTGPTTQWFVGLGSEITGRAWFECRPDAARTMVAQGVTFIKLADGKHPGFPAARYFSTDAFDDAVAAVGGSAQLQLLATRTWLPIDSEYRIFTCGRQVMTYCPYRIQDEPWTPLLYTHRASFHDEAAAWAREVLDQLGPLDVPPAAVLDVACLENGRFVLLEANQSWGAGLYGCDPHQALVAVLAANAGDAAGPEDRWAWRPDETLRYESLDSSGGRGADGGDRRRPKFDEVDALIAQDPCGEAPILVDDAEEHMPGRD